MAKDSIPQQLHLNVSLREDATFDNFYLADASKNAEIVATLKSQLQTPGGSCFYLWGKKGSGRTHLLQGACHWVQAQAQTCVYLPFKEIAGYESRALLDGLERQNLVCLDDVQIVAGNRGWEEAVFDLYNRLREGNKHLIVTANRGPHELPLQLSDLRSRLSAGYTYKVEALTDTDKPKALQKSAKGRGLDMSNEVAEYILNRAPRDMSVLFDILEHLDEMSLSTQRKLTKPFVKEVLGW